MKNKNATQEYFIVDKKCSSSIPGDGYTEVKLSTKDIKLYKKSIN
jgi:hypothetical protein